MTDQPAVGTSVHQTALAELVATSRGRRFLVTLTPEPTNPHDRHAVRISANGATLGYLPSEDAKAFLEDMAEIGPHSTAEAWARTVGGTLDYPTIGLRLDLRWPLQLA